MRARFRRLFGIFGAIAVVTTTVTGAVLTMGQGVASATVNGTPPTVAVDIAPNNVGQNYGDTPASGVNFTVSNWHPGDTITLTIGPSNGQLTSSTAYAGIPGVAAVGGAIAGTGDTGDGNCLTQMSPVFPANTSIGYFGVNQTDDDRGNWVGFDAGDGATGTVAASGSSAPEVLPFVENPISCSNPENTDRNDTIGTSYENLVLELQCPGLVTSCATGSAVIYVGFSATYDGGLVTSTLDPLFLDVSFGAWTGPIQTTGAYAGLGCSSAACVTPLVVQSFANIIGETPSDTHALNVLRNTDPAQPSNVFGQNGGDQVNVGSPISNFVINEVGDFLPPPDTAASVFGTIANYYVGPNLTPVVSPSSSDNTTDASTDGAVCLVIDNATHNNLIWTSTPSWSVAPGESQAGFTGSAGGNSVLGKGTQILQLPVAEASNFPAVWTASGLTVGTSGGNHTHADGPVWAAAYWEQDASFTGSGSCQDIAEGSGFQTLTDDTTVGSPNLTFDERHNSQELGYVQITTVTELADSVFGATTDATAAQALEHQFDYAKGDCVGSPYPNFVAGGAVFLARDDTWPDTLGADYPAGADATGVLLTPSNSLDSNALAAIRLEGVSTVYLLGGTSAQSAANFIQLSQTPSYLCGGATPRVNILGLPENLTVIRIGGNTTQDTNEMLAEFPGAEPITPVPGAVGAFAAPMLFNDTGAGISSQPTLAQVTSTENSAILVTDASFQDAASASAVAYAWPMPLIVTDPCALTPQALSALYNDDIDQIFLLGGTGAVCDGVVTTLQGLGFAVLRIAGMDGSDTSTQFAAFTLAAGVAPLADANLHTVGLGASNADFLWSRFTARTAGQITFVDDNITAHVVLLARGDFYADAIAAGAVLSVHNGRFNNDCSTSPDDCTISPIVLSESPSNLGAPVTKFLNLAGLAVSGLAGETANFGDNLSWQGQNFPTSSVYVIQPIGGPVALNPSLLTTAINSVG